MPNNEGERRKRTVSFTHEFKRNLRQLAKKYKRIQKDIQPIIDDVESGSLPGDRIPGIRFELFKVRARNSDSAKGKSGGYRVVYQRTEKDTIILVTIYSKTEQSDIATQEIQAIIEIYEQEQADKSEQEEENENEDTTREE